MEYYHSLILLLINIHIVLSTTVLEGPTNTSVLIGTDVILKCTIQSQSEGQFVFWKLLNSSGHVERMASYNNNSLDNDLYSVMGIYNLVVKQTTVDSEGLYMCDTGDEQLIVGLTVSVPMKNMTVYWGPVIPYTLNTWTNITCLSTRSRPAADLRWFYGSTEITKEANNFFKDTGPDGYGDSISTIDVQVTSTQIPYRCVADLPGKNDIRTEFIFPPVTGSAVGDSSQIYCLLLMMIAAIALSL